ncbi:MAG: proteasome accessory factor PafA2 family protein, partial [Verrucomicrobiales bacterium]
AQHFQGRDDETDALLALWKQTNDALQEGETTSLVGILDWVTKKYLFEHFCEAEGILMTDAWLESQDLEFHQVIPERNLGLPLSKEGPWSVDLEAAVTECFTEPPSTTRAAARSRLMKQIDPVHDDYIVDWDSVRWSNQVATLSDPYNLDPTIRENEEDIAERLSGWPSADLD